MVQLEEECANDSPARIAGYNTICELAIDRIRRAGTKIRNELSEKENAQMSMDNSAPLTPHFSLDTGFRVFKLDSSNMEDVYYNAEEITQEALAEAEINIKPDRTDLDLLFGCLLEWGLPLSLPYRSEKVEGYTIHTYNDGDLVACFDKNIPESAIRSIASRRYDGQCALRAVFRDISFSGSPEKINVEEIFKLLSPDTRVKVI